MFVGKTMRNLTPQKKSLYNVVFRKAKHKWKNKIMQGKILNYKWHNRLLKQLKSRIKSRIVKQVIIKIIPNKKPIERNRKIELKEFKKSNNKRSDFRYFPLAFAIRFQHKFLKAKCKIPSR